MWSTDVTQAWFRKEEGVAVLMVVVHFVGNVVGIRAARFGTCFEAPGSIHQRIQERYDILTEDLAVGLVLYHDHGPQRMKYALQQEIAFLDTESSSSFIRSPRENRVEEHHIYSLKEHFLRVWACDSAKAFRRVLLDCMTRFNRYHPPQRHGYKIPAKVPEKYEPAKEAA